MAALGVAIAAVSLTVPGGAAATEPAPAPGGPALGLTHYVSLKTSSTGAALRLSCSSSDGQGCSGAIFITSDETLQGKKVIAVGTSNNRTKASVRIGQGSFSLAAGATATFQVKLNSTGLQLLRRFHTISAWVLANEAMASNSSPVIFLLHEALFESKKKRHPTQSGHPNKHHR